MARTATPNELRVAPPTVSSRSSCRGTLPRVSARRVVASTDAFRRKGAGHDDTRARRRQRDPAARPRRLAGARRARSARTRSAGRSSSATATSTRRRPTATRRASAARCATAACRARRSSSRPSSIPAREDPEAEAQRSLRAARRRPGRPLHHPLAAGRPDVGVAGHGARARARATRARSASRTSASRELDELLGGRRRRRRSSTRCSSARSSTGARCSRRASERGVALEAYSPLGTGRHLSDDARRARSPSASGARRPRCCCAGACSASSS